METNRENNDGYTDEEGSDDGSVWDDGLTDNEIQSVLGFLRQIANENEVIEAFNDDDDDDSGEESDERSTTSMTTTAATTYISSDSTEDDDFAIETQDETDDYEERVFYFASQ